MTHEDFKFLFNSYHYDERPWALSCFCPELIDDSYWFVLFRKYLKHHYFYGDAETFHWYRDLYDVVFGSIHDVPLYIGSDVPGVCDIARYRLLRGV